MTEQGRLWPNVEDQFYTDLERLHKRHGPIHAILFTGDLTQRGSADEFIALDKQLDSLFAHLQGLGSKPLFLAVPGNHDLVRPKIEEEQRTNELLARWHNSPQIKTQFFTGPADEKGDGAELRRTVTSAFANYKDWWSRRCKASESQILVGDLAGDFAATLTCGASNLVVVGLNSAFLQLTKDVQQATLDIDVRQLTSIRTEILSFIRSHAAALLLTHHPPNWLSPAGLEHYYESINPPGRFALHLYGHMHEAASLSSEEGGTVGRRYIQGRSLFGLDKYTSAAGVEIERSHGYSLLRLAFDKDAIACWPRKYHRNEQSRSSYMQPDYDRYQLVDESFSYSIKAAKPFFTDEDIGRANRSLVEKLPDLSLSVWSPPRIGMRVGDFQLNSPLGDGRFAVVWRATNINTGTDCALRIFRPVDFPDDVLQAATRFCRGAAAMDHLRGQPGIAQLLTGPSIDFRAGYLWFTLELFDTDLEKELKGDRLSLEDGEAIVNQIVDTLQLTHQQEVFHRDIRPANVLIRRASPLLAVLADFDIVYYEKALFETGSTALSWVDKRIFPPHLTSLDPASELARAEGRVILRDPLIDPYQTCVLIHTMFIGFDKRLLNCKSRRYYRGEIRRSRLARASHKRSYALTHRVASLLAVGLDAKQDRFDGFRTVAELRRYWQTAKWCMWRSVFQGAFAVGLLAGTASLFDSLLAGHYELYVEIVVGLVALVCSISNGVLFSALLARFRKEPRAEATAAGVVCLASMAVAGWLISGSVQRLGTATVTNARHCQLAVGDSSVGCQFDSFVLSDSSALQISCPMGTPIEVSSNSYLEPWRPVVTYFDATPSPREPAFVPVVGGHVDGSPPAGERLITETLLSGSVDATHNNIVRGIGRVLSLPQWDNPQRLLFTLTGKPASSVNELLRRALVATNAMDDKQRGTLGFARSSALAGHLAGLLRNCTQAGKYLTRSLTGGGMQVVEIWASEAARCLASDDGYTAVMSQLRAGALNQAGRMRLAQILVWVAESDDPLLNEGGFARRAVMLLGSLGVDWLPQEVSVLLRMSQKNSCEDVAFAVERVERRSRENVAFFLARIRARPDYGQVQCLIGEVTKHGG